MLVSALASALVLSSLVATPALAAGPNGEIENADEASEDTEEIFDSRLCPEIFGDEAIVETNRLQRTEKLQAVWRGPAELNLMHQVPWWTAPRAVRMPHALIVEVVPAEEDAEDAVDTSASASESTTSDATGAAVTASEPAPEGAAVEASKPVPTSASGSASDSFIINHSKNGPPRPEVDANVEWEATVELDDSFGELCEPGLYRVGVDDALGQEARIFAILEEGVLIESEQNLGLVVIEDGPPPPSWRMIWRSSYAIEFEQAPSKAAKKKKKKKKKRSRRSRKKKKKKKKR